MIRILLQICFGMSVIVSATSSAECEQGCQNCTLGVCLSCASGFYKTEKSCTKCHKGCSVCQNEYDCDECIDSFGLVNRTCTACSKGCKRCDFDFQHTCRTCFAGYFRDGALCKSCLDNCIACSSLDKCEKCNKGSFLDESKCSDCPLSCLSCVSSETCGECKSNNYGIGCQFQCSEGCEEGVCDKSTGQCSCKSGFYSKFCNQTCPDNCYDCTSGSNCTKCKNGYYGTTCNKSCSYGCSGRRCNQSSGLCIYCKENFVGHTCNKCYDGTYGNDCQNLCPVNCSSCNSDKNCTNCKNGFYGDLCLNQCSDGCAANSCDKSTGKCDMCKAIENKNSCENCRNENNNLCDNCTVGLSGEYCNYSCPNNCKDKHCNQLGYCYSCINGYTGQFCTNHCPLNCLKRSCDALSDTCKYGCTKGFYGKACNLTCNSVDPRCLNCSTDARGNYYGCTECDKGFYPPLKQNKVGLCEDNDCYAKMGLCNDLCEMEKYWGDQCNINCPHNCSICVLSTGKCKKCNKTNMFGAKCENSCSLNCINETCLFESGACTLGCTGGFFGDTCDLKCSDSCLNRTCRQNDGECLYGCRNGSEGPRCQHKVKGTSLDISGFIIGIVLLIITLFVCIIIAVNKRHTRLNNCVSANDEMATYCAMDMGRPEDQEIIQRRFADSEHDQNSTTHMYANMLEMRAITDNDFSRCRELNISVVEVVEHGQENHGEFKSDNERSIIYGNTEELQKRRIPVNDLQEYLSKKTEEEMAEEFFSLPKDLIKSYEESQKEENVPKNRYKGIYPYDMNRVVIGSIKSENNYINASYIDGYNKRRAYIACIGPTAKHMDNFVPFWEMVWRENVNTIVMLTNLIELGIAKCDKYWPDIDHTVHYGDVIVTCQLENVSADYAVRTFMIKKAHNSRICHQIHFTSWQDKRVPDTVSSIVELQRIARKYNKDSDGPLLVHCSAGIGRTGTFIALDILTNEGEADGHVDIYACVRNLREERVNLVQTLGSDDPWFSEAIEIHGHRGNP